MIGEYSIMDITMIGTVIGVFATFVGMVVSIVAIIRDNRALRTQLKTLSEENKVLKTTLSKEHDEIKSDTSYVVDTLKIEKMARESLYHTTNKAQTILDTMDIMKEVVIQNYELQNRVSDLLNQNEKLLESDKDSKEQILGILSMVNSRLSELENYREAQEIQVILKSIRDNLRRV
ncbi:hypothetical protein [Streptococcus danieliae]|uniref:hypothetical protein n=1 Tax=Streptococcus danieliae TaxID=747656 RepID=UPI0026EA0C28|nr:hypothetical protein [Streptococcus danieliae]